MQTLTKQQTDSQTKSRLRERERDRNVCLSSKCPQRSRERERDSLCTCVTTLELYRRVYRGERFVPKCLDIYVGICVCKAPGCFRQRLARDSCLPLSIDQDRYPGLDFIQPSVCLSSAFFLSSFILPLFFYLQYINVYSPIHLSIQLASQIDGELDRHVVAVSIHPNRYVELCV